MGVAASRIGQDRSQAAARAPSPPGATTTAGRDARKTVDSAFMDQLLCALAVGAGRRVLAYWLLVGNLVVTLVTDTAFSVLALRGADTGPTDAGYVVGYVLLGAAALHPSMVSISEPAPEAVRGLGLVDEIVLVDAEKTQHLEQGRQRGFAMSWRQRLWRVHDMDRAVPAKLAIQHRGCGPPCGAASDDGDPPDSSIRCHVCWSPLPDGAREASCAT